MIRLLLVLKNSASTFERDILKNSKQDYKECLVWNSRTQVSPPLDHRGSHTSTGETYALKSRLIKWTRKSTPGDDMARSLRSMSMYYRIFVMNTAVFVCKHWKCIHFLTISAGFGRLTATLECGIAGAFTPQNKTRNEFVL